MIFKCPCCNKVHEAKDNVIISVCKECQIEMEKIKEGKKDGEKRDR